MESQPRGFLGGAANTCDAEALDFDYSAFRVNSLWLRRCHGVFSILWMVLWAVSIFTGWIDSVTFVSHMSMAALVYTSVAAWQGARTEVKHDEDVESDGHTHGS